MSIDEASGALLSLQPGLLTAVCVHHAYVETILSTLVITISLSLSLSLSVHDRIIPGKAKH